MWRYFDREGLAASGLGRQRARRALYRSRLIAIIVGGLVAAGCASDPKAVGVDPSQLPAPDPIENATLQQQDYRIGPNDTLEISVYPVDELNRTVQVDAAGAIAFPLIGTIAASTKTPKQLAADIAAALSRRDLASPEVSVFVKESVSQRFTVEGAVRKPGVFPLAGRVSMLQAIATAEGVDQLASLDNIVIFRTVNGQRVAGIVDLPRVRAGQMPDPQIHPGDVIVVPTSNSRRALRDIIGLTPLASFLTPFGL